ncbi:MAG: response regulator, partial [Solirubrobacterales bacterium]|nr:response regulator [Solirubrobacterales bacterium]
AALAAAGAAASPTLGVVSDLAPADALQDVLDAFRPHVLASAEAEDWLRTAVDAVAVVLLGEDPEGPLALLRRLAEDPGLSERPVVVQLEAHHDRSVREQAVRLAERMVLMVSETPEELLELTARVLHLPESTLEERHREQLRRHRMQDSALEGKLVLIIDDDIRNVFALTSAFEQRGLRVVYAEDGREGIARLREHPDVELVLLDVMMPEMDGYEAARAIRELPGAAGLPIISLTAKALPGDREKSLAAGASDYITKPVDLPELLTLMRVWLHR